jgi:hypothetical protein
MTETLKRDEWMIMPTSTSNATASISRTHLPTGDESLTDDYGEPSQGARTLGGAVDFFATLGTERQKHSRTEPHDPAKVWRSRLLRTSFMLIFAATCQLQRT